MARIRSINPCAPKDEDVARLSLAARYVWAFIPCQPDREGRLKDSAFTLKTEILPADNVDMEAVLAELAAARLIIRYEANGRRYIQIRTFLRHQSPHTREIQSIIPPPPGEVVTEHDLGDASAKAGQTNGAASDQPGVAGVSRGPSHAVPDPSPVSSSLSPLRPPAGARSENNAKVWPPHRWRSEYGLAWCQRYQQIAYGMASDSKGCESLSYVLDVLPVEERVEGRHARQ